MTSKTTAWLKRFAERHSASPVGALNIPTLTQQSVREEIFGERSHSHNLGVPRPNYGLAEDNPDHRRDWHGN